MLPADTFARVVDLARLAPSTHNTQPARWSLSDGGITVWADLSRRLPVGDADDRDLHVSCGAAVEGTVLALAAHGIGAEVTAPSVPQRDGYRAMATVRPTGPAPPENEARAAHMPLRACNRSGFGTSTPAQMTALTDWAARQTGVTLVKEPDAIAQLAREVDVASARIMRNRAFRDELLSWMRLSRRHPQYDRDGLNRAALNIPGPVAALARPVLGSPIYDGLARLGLGPALSGEAATTAKASAIALMHWPDGQSMLDAGRALYRAWLDLGPIGLTAWPAAALADDAQTRAAITARYTLPQGQTLYNALRLGPAVHAAPSRVRVPGAELTLG